MAKNPVMDISREQGIALLVYRDANGKQWKSKLSMDWMRAGYPSVSSGHGAALQQIRNTYGPSWLAKVTNANLDELAALCAECKADAEDESKAGC